VSPNYYRKLYGEIILGHSFFEETHFGPLYIKHLNNLDLSHIENLHEVYLQEAKSRGVFTHEEKIKYLIENGQWSEGEENKIKELKSLLSQYETNKSNEILKSKRDIWVTQLEQLSKDIKDLELKKHAILGETAESLAYRKSNLLHIKEAFYKDSNLKKRLFSKKEFNELSSDDIEKLYEIFTSYLNGFNQENIKKISLSSFFMNMFNLTESVYEFYGKAVIYLSFYQIDLVSWGKYFRQVLGEMKTKLPVDILNNPDKIIEYVELNKNYEKAFPDKKDAGGSMAIPGAKKEDLAILGLKAEGNKKFDEVLSKKGRLEADDIFNMMG